MKCPRWVSRDIIHGKELDKLEDLLLDDSVFPEIRLGVLKSRGEFEHITDEDQDDAAMRTLSFMKSGAKTIAGGVLIDEHWVGRPDVLERVEGKSDLGDYYYVAVDVKRLHIAEQIKDPHKLQGAFYAELLFRVQGVKPNSGYILSPEGAILRYDLESFEADFALTLSEIEKILAGEEPAHILTSGCKTSPYFAMCVDETESCDDIGLLNRIQREEVDELKRAGVSTVLELALADSKMLSQKLLDIDDERLRFLQTQAIAMKERLHKVWEKVEFQKSDYEIYFDVESDPLRDADYLFGVLIVEKTADGSFSERYEAFIAERPEDEGKAFTAFTALLDEHQDAPVYHFGWYEISVLSRMMERYGAPEGAKQSFANNFIDLNAFLRGKIIFPLSFYSLKDLARYIGFEWRAEDAGGVNSIRWYHEWLETGNRAFLERIRQYNEDDVRATRKLKEWAEEQGKGIGELKN